VDAGRRLEELGLVRAQVREFVRCADPQDADFPPRNRHCRGQIYLGDGLDEPGHEFRCPECERPVFPERFGKRRHKELRVQVLPNGVKSHVRGELAKLNVNLRDLADGVFRVDLGEMGVVVCLVDYCAESRFLSRDWASTNPTC
jgi:hypothetical protein